MVIDNKFLYFKTFSNFQKELELGNILSTSIVYIEDVKIIYTHEQYYNCSGLSEEQTTKLSKIELEGIGNMFLSNDGSYKSVNISKEENNDEMVITKTISPNIFYQFGEVTSLTLTLDSEISGVYNEYMIQFTSGESPTNLIFTDNIKWIGGVTPTIESNKVYQISIVNKLAVIGGF